jgi:hypothetical protein
MTRRGKQKATRRRRPKRGLANRLPRSNKRGKAKPKKPAPKVPSERDKAVVRRKAGPQVKSTVSREATAAKKSAKHLQRKAAPDPRLEIAVKEMNRGSSLTEAARSSNLSPKSLQASLKQRRLVRRKADRWIIKDTRPRQVPVITRGRIRVVTVDGYEEARLVGQHYQAAGDFVRTNDIQVIKPFDGQSVRPVKGKPIPLETDPNALHRIAAMDSPPFHEIYEITSNT